MNRKEFIITLVATFIVVMIWIIADILHTRTSVPTSSNLNLLIEPLNPTFDQQTLEKIKQRSNFRQALPVPATSSSQIIETP